MVLPLVLASFLLLYACLILYYRRGWRSLSNHEPGALQPVFISVLVPARNEATTIIPLLQALHAQTYPPEFFEVIVIDDFSTDNTPALVKSFPFPNLQLISPDADAAASSKKKAIESGVKKAKGELIVTTDADCVPPPQWLQAMASFYVQKDAGFIAAPVKFTHDGSLVQIFQSVDFLMLQGITAASLASRFHAMCNGANLAYAKKYFLDVGGFEGIDRLASGDDMLLMHKIWKKEKEKVLYLKARDAIVCTQPMPSWRSFLSQRKRWASKTFVYDDRRIIFVLGFVYLFNCYLLFLMVYVCFHPVYAWLAAAAWIIKALTESLLLLPVASFYGEKKIFRWLLFFQPLHIVYTVAIGLISQAGAYEWKGRKTK